jgi:hypothetical protein
MTPLFVDTAGWMACADASDPSHLSSGELRITQALTTGRHFRQMGFQLVPGSSPRLRRR